jgi:predicted PurR-regulated permease PerM
MAQRLDLRFVVGMLEPPDDKVQDHEARDAFAAYVRKVLVTLALVVLALVLFAWRHVLLLAFGACLVAVMLRALADPIRRRTPLGSGASLGAAVIAILLMVGALGIFVGGQVSRQLTQLQVVLPAAWATARAQIATYETGRWALDHIREAATNSMRGLGPLAGRIGRATGAGAQAIGELVVVLVAGVYFAAQPRLYFRGLLKLAPAGARERLAEAVDACGVALRKWLVGTGAAMVTMGVLIGIGAALLGLPAPIALGLVSGMAEFVPIVGAALSAVPGLLVAATQGPQTVLWTLIFYVAAHQLEGQVLIPIIQRRVVAVPPALTLFSVVGFGVLFGPLGVIFATPLAVVAMVLIERLYIQPDADDGEPPNPAATEPVGARGTI